MLLDGKKLNLLQQRTSVDFASAVRSMSVHLDLAVTQDGLISHNGIRTGDCDDDYDAEEDEEEEDDDNETGVGEVQEVVAAGMFDWMGLSSTIAPIIVPLAEGESLYLPQ